MAVPDYQSLMLPLMQFSGDGKAHTLSEAMEYLADHFKLSSDERKELLPSGTQYRFDNRVHWARSYLKQAGLLENPSRGSFMITPDGRKVLDSKPGHIDVKLLMQFDAFQDFRSRSKKDDNKKVLDDEGELSQTPKEAIEEGYQKIRDELAAEVLSAVMKCSPKFFENLVVELLIKMGYGGSRKDAGQAIGQSSDGGIDGIIKEDKLGLDVIYLQAKRWEGSVGSKEIRNFVGSLAGQKANKGVFITTSSFTKEALGFVANIQQKVILIDGDRLAQLMIDNDIGVSKIASYDIKKIDSDYFTDDF